MKKISNLNNDGEEVWLIVDENNKPMKSFRTKSAAKSYRKNLQLNKYDKLEVKHKTELQKNEK